MTLEEVKQAYIDKFGGYPSFLLMGADDNEIKAALQRCLDTGEELEAPNPDDVY